MQKGRSRFLARLDYSLQPFSNDATDMPFDAIVKVVAVGRDDYIHRAAAAFCKFFRRIQFFGFFISSNVEHRASDL